MAAMQGRTNVASWVLGIGLGAVFVAVGASKLLGASAQVAHFSAWGYPPWTRLVVGAVEVLGGILAALPRLRRFGGGLLACIMLGAVVTHLKQGEWDMLPPPLLLLGLSLALGWLHRPPG